MAVLPRGWVPCFASVLQRCTMTRDYCLKGAPLIVVVLCESAACVIVLECNPFSCLTSSFSLPPATPLTQLSPGDCGSVECRQEQHGFWNEPKDVGSLEVMQYGRYTLCLLHCEHEPSNRPQTTPFPPSVHLAPPPPALLQVWWLQLGLVNQLHGHSLSWQNPQSDGHQGTKDLPYRKLVCVSLLLFFFR